MMPNPFVHIYIYVPFRWFSDTILNKFEMKQKRTNQSLQEMLQDCQDDLNDKVQQQR
jgi:hypothetical protein